MAVMAAALVLLNACGEPMVDNAGSRNSVLEDRKAVKLDGAMFYNAEFSAPWCARSIDARTVTLYLSPNSQQVIIFHLLTEGRGYAYVEGDDRPVPLNAGDILIVPHGDAHILGNGPSGMPSPVLWGDEATVRERLGRGLSELNLVRRHATFSYPFPPSEMVEFFRLYYGPTNQAFASLDAGGWERLRQELEALWSSYNRAGADCTTVFAEYLEVIGIRT